MQDIHALRTKIGMFRGGQAPRETKQIAEYLLDLCDHIDALSERIKQLEGERDEPAGE